MAHLRKIVRSNVQDIIFKYAPENIVVTNTAYKACNDGAPTAGIQRKSGNSQLTNVLNSLKLAGILDLTTIEEIVDAKNIGNKQAECVAALAELIKNEMESGHKVNLGDLWATLQKEPYGYYNTIACGVLLWDGDYYYLRGFCDERNALRTFRVDRIEEAPTILRDLVVPKPDDYSIAEYSKSVFRMYDTDKPILVSLKCDVRVMKAVVDMFGIDVDTKPINEKAFTANVRVCPSPTFYSWIFCFHGLIKIQSPESIVQEYRSMLDSELKDSSNSI